jgi:hypothetical protein
MRKIWHDIIFTIKRLYSGGARFEPGPEHWLSWCFIWFSSISPRKFRISASVRLRHLPSISASTSLPTVQPYIQVSLDTEKASLNNSRWIIFPTTYIVYSWNGIIRGSRDSSVGIATSYGLDGRGVGVRVSSPRRPDRLWGPPNLLSTGYRGFFPGG